MKKRIIKTIVAGLTIGILCGCGKSAQEDMSNQLQKEWGMTNSEADEMASAILELETDTGSSGQEIVSQEEVFKLYEASDTIKNSKFSDEIVQVRSVVLPIDGSLTVREMIDRISVDGEVTVKATQNNGKKEVVSEERLIEPNKLGYYSIYDEKDVQLCDVKYVNDSDSIAGVYDGKVLEIEAENWSVNSLNIFYSGDICAGCYSSSSEVKETEAYTKRIEDYPLLTYQNAEEILKKKGFENPELIQTKSFDLLRDISIYQTRFYSGKPLYDSQYGEMYRVKELTFTLDMDTAKFYMTCMYSYHTSDIAMERNVCDLSVIDDELIAEIKESAAYELSSWIYDKANGDLELVGFYTDGEDLYVACHTDRDTYEPAQVKIDRCYDGKYRLNSISAWHNDPYSSFDAIIADEGVDESFVYRIK